MTKLYRLKPIKWEEREDGRFARAETSVGNYTVAERGWSWSGHQQGTVSRGSTSESGSLEEAKAAAQAHRDERILSMLEEVEVLDEGYWTKRGTTDEVIASGGIYPQSAMGQSVAIVKLEDEQ